MLSRPITLQRLCSLSRQLHFHPVLILSVLLSIGLQVAWAEQSPCSFPHTHLTAVNPAYRDAMELARFLQSRGLVVDCVLLSTEERMFEGQEGAANFQTELGVFEVLFLSKPQTFNALEIVAQQETGRYLYSFRGSPRALHIHWEGVRPTYFFKHEKQLFNTLDKQAEAKLEEAFQSF
jgi:hypothetical protein